MTTTNTQTLPTPWRIEKPGFPNGTYTVVVAADGTYVVADGSPETKARIVHYANCYPQLLAACKAALLQFETLADTYTDEHGDVGYLSGGVSTALQAAITFAETGEQ